MTNLRLGVAAVVILLMAIGFSVWRDHENHLRTCREIGAIKTALIQTLEEGRRFGASSHVRSAAEKQRIITFYTDALSRLRPRHC